VTSIPGTELMRLLPDHPRVQIERTVTDNLLDGTALAGLLLSWTIILTTWPDLPDSVPQHFTLAGEPDAWGSPGFMLLLPSIGILLFGGLIALLRIPHRFNYLWPITAWNARFQYRRAQRVIQILNLLIQWFFCAFVWEISEIALGRDTTLLPWLTPLFFLAIFSLIAAYIIFGNRTQTRHGGFP